MAVLDLQILELLVRLLRLLRPRLLVAAVLLALLHRLPVRVVPELLLLLLLVDSWRLLWELLHSCNCMGRIPSPKAYVLLQR